MIKLINKMALSNLRQQRSLYFPFSLAVLVSVTIYYIFLSIATNPGIEDAPYGGSTMKAALEFGIFIIAVTVLFIMFYANSFVRKNRTKELGLYTILGLEKRHLHLLTALETLYFSIATIFLGLLFGVLFENLAFAFLLNAIDYSLPLRYSFQWGNIAQTLIYFSLVFFFLYLYNAFQLQFGKPVELLKNANKGEKQGKFLTIRALIGLVLLLSGYFLSLTTDNIVYAIPTFFSAVFLVVIGTFILFDAGTIRFLQFLKNRPNIYYKPQNFISISNLIFRMRKNAAGLASICILSTMVLITLTASLSLQVEREVTIEEQVPFDFNFRVAYHNRDDLSNLYESKPTIDMLLKTSNDPVTDAIQFSSLKAFGAQTKSGDGFQFSSPSDMSLATTLNIIDIEDYNRLLGQTISLDKDKLILLTNNPNQEIDHFTIGNKTYPLQNKLDSKSFIQRIPSEPESSFIDKELYLIAENLDDIYTNLDTDKKFANFYTGWKTAHSADKVAQEEQAQLYATQLSDSGWSFNLSYKVALENQAFSTYGTVFFVGLFLSLLFFTGTVLVIYYKQISEGLEDRQRFDVLQKVGLDDIAIKQTINRQVLIVFFLPIFVALLHVAMAFPLTNQILQQLGVYNFSLVLQTTALVSAAFVIAYFVIYRITSYSYLRIVKR